MLKSRSLKNFLSCLKSPFVHKYQSWAQAASPLTKVINCPKANCSTIQRFKHCYDFAVVCFWQPVLPRFANLGKFYIYNCLTLSMQFLTRKTVEIKGIWSDLSCDNYFSEVAQNQSRLSQRDLFWHLSGTTEGQIVHVEHYRFNRFHDSVLQHNVQIYVQLALFKWNACTAVTAALNVKAVSSFPPVCTIAEIFLKNRFNLDDF